MIITFRPNKTCFNKPSGYCINNLNKISNKRCYNLNVSLSASVFII